MREEKGVFVRAFNFKFEQGAPEEEIDAPNPWPAVQLRAAGIDQDRP